MTGNAHEVSIREVHSMTIRESHENARRWFLKWIGLMAPAVATAALGKNLSMFNGVALQARGGRELIPVPRRLSKARFI